MLSAIATSPIAKLALMPICLYLGYALYTLPIPSTQEEHNRRIFFTASFLVSLGMFGFCIEKQKRIGKSKSSNDMLEKAAKE